GVLSAVRAHRAFRDVPVSLGGRARNGGVAARAEHGRLVAAAGAGTGHGGRGGAGRVADARPADGRRRGAAGRRAAAGGDRPGGAPLLLVSGGGGVAAAHGRDAAVGAGGRAGLRGAAR